MQWVTLCKRVFFYKALHALKLYFAEQNFENIERLKSLGEELFLYAKELFALYKENISQEAFYQHLNVLLQKEKDKEFKELFEKEFHEFNKLDTRFGATTFEELLHLFLARLAQKAKDDVGGGKVTCMGVLESRGMAFEGVIVLDFNDDFVPRKSDKDMFLNSTLRKRANLPVSADRENLQKYYFQRLFAQAKEVSIAYVKTEESLPSRFLYELEVQTQKIEEEKAFASLILKSNAKPALQEYHFEQAFDFSQHKLSASSLKCFLSCKRKFFFRYVQKLQEHEVPHTRVQEHELGTNIHEALKHVYEEEKSFTDIKALEQSFLKHFEANLPKSAMHHYLKALWQKRLAPFFKEEIKRFREGFCVHRCEEYVSAEIDGLNLRGFIDRVDKRDNTYHILDYKTGSFKLYTPRTIEKATDFQLEFYYLLAQQFGMVESVAFYDLKEGKVVPEAMLEEKLALLRAHLQRLKQMSIINFEKTEELAECRLCPYVHLCHRV